MKFDFKIYDKVINHYIINNKPIFFINPINPNAWNIYEEEKDLVAIKWVLDKKEMRGFQTIYSILL